MTLPDSTVCILDGAAVTRYEVAGYVNGRQVGARSG